jgi:hypothetical protein
MAGIVNRNLTVKGFGGSLLCMVDMKCVKKAVVGEDLLSSTL